VSTERDRQLRQNEEKAQAVKAELVQHHQAMLRCEDELNALAIERTNLESDLDEEKMELPIKTGKPVEVETLHDPKSRWPKVVVGGVVLVAILLGLGGLGMFNNDGSEPVVPRAVLVTPHIVAPSTTKGNTAAIIKPSSVPLSANVNPTSDKIHSIPNEVQMNILPGITYTSEISYSMKSSAITLVEVSETPLITLHLFHTPQSFFIPMRTAFRVDREGIDTQLNGTLIFIADSRKRDLEIRFESRKLPLERKILGVSSSQ
jgi:hypothetical protein